MVASAAIGGTLQYGYNLAIMNAPTVVSVLYRLHNILLFQEHFFFLVTQKSLWLNNQQCTSHKLLFKSGDELWCRFQSLLYFFCGFVSTRVSLWLIFISSPSYSLFKRSSMKHFWSAGTSSWKITRWPWCGQSLFPSSPWEALLELWLLDLWPYATEGSKCPKDGEW